MYQFSFNGGSKKGDLQSEKFMLFALINGREIPYYSLRKNNLVSKTGEKQYQSPYQDWKLFSHITNFGDKPDYHSWYLRLVNDGPLVKISPLSQSQDWWFTSRFRVLKKDAVLGLLLPSEPSFKFVEGGSMDHSPYRHLLAVQKEVVKGVRQIRI